MICAPGRVGFGLHRTLPREPLGAFHDLASWRQGVVEVLGPTLTRHDGVVIAPMTVIGPGHFPETVGRLRERGLGRSPGPVRAISVGRWQGGRGAAPGGSWAVAQLDRGLTRLREPEFAGHLWTDPTVPRTAGRIAVLAGLTLTPDREGALRTRLRQARVGLKHIRSD
ncbi:hypothetical protein GCM10010145_67300 [Streptomyces ruber]|uniref:Uncharacterized protein n=2 Tax=Streptomyces TaxID=1883 RepID=A0A918EYW5_9ACTN|nr:hypothetical protein GCM10010145_67300 [Streptomyces ruber]